MPCPSCSSAYLDPYGRCPACGSYGPPGAGAYPPPAGQVVYGAPSAPTGVATATQILLAVQAFASVFGIVGSAVALASLLDTGYTSDISTALNALTSLLAAPTFLAAVVLFIIWFYKSRVNADILAPGSRKVFSRGWSIGGWFTPIGFSFIPRGVAGDIWAASRPLGPEDGRDPRRSGLLTSWWICWCLMWVLSTVGGGFAGAEPGGETLSVREAVAIVGIAGSMAHVAAAVLALFVVRRITTMQQIRILQGPGLNHPYALQTPTTGAPGLPQQQPGHYPAQQYAPQPYAPQPYAPQPYAPSSQPYLPTQPQYPPQAAPVATPEPTPVVADQVPEDAAPEDAKPAAEPPVDLGKPAPDSADAP